MTSLPPQPAPRPSPSGLAGAAERLRPEISAYPGSITYLDLIRKNKRQSTILIIAMLILGMVLGAVLAGAIAAYGGVNDLMPSVVLGAIAALVAGSLGTLWSWFGGASAILAMSGGQEIAKEDDPQLFNVVDELRIAAGVPMPRVFLIDDSAMNAFATGRDPQHAAVARDELQGVLAHEMSHVRHYDIRFALLMATMVGLIVFACDAFRRILWYGGPRGGGGRSRDDDGKGGGGLAVVLIVAAIVLSILAPMVAFFIQMAYSRQREYLADAGAVELTRNPEGLASALVKLADDPEPLVDTANRGTAHLYIVNPLRAMREARQALDSAFSSHPPIQDRIARLLALAR
jgi:heat shock protein HtpX